MEGEEECDNSQEDRTVTFVSPEEHNRHGLLMSHLSTLIKDEDTSPPSGPPVCGCLLRIRDHLVTKEDAQSLLESLSRQPCVPLNYEEGLTYTFGNQKFASLSNQEGEFLGLNVDDENGTECEDPKEEVYFHLECKDNSFWIRPVTVDVQEICPTTMVSINGATLERNLTKKVNINNSPTTESLSSLRRKLTFGDTITVSFNFGDEGKRKRRSCDFIFKASNPRIKDDNSCDIVNGRSESPLDNYLVVQNILGSIPTKQVKELRFLSRLWNTEALKLLRTRVIVTVFECPNYSANGGGHISNYAQSELNQLQFPHWKIALPECKLGDEMIHLGQSKTIRDKKIFDDLVWFLDPRLNSHNVKSLHLSGRLHSERRLKIFEVVLGALWDTLTDLHLNLKFRLDVSTFATCLGEDDFFLFPSTMSEVPGLKSLSLSLEDDKDKPGLKSFLMRFIQGFLPRVPNIQTLNLMNTTLTSFLFSKHVLQEVVKIQANDPQKFLHLRKITIATGVTFNIQPLSLLREGSLKELELGELIIGTPSLSELRRALERHADSLETLTLRLNLNSGMLSINFPRRMENLKKLSVFLQLKQPPVIRFKFGEGDVIGDGDGTVDRIDYNYHFPSLSNLTVQPTTTTLPMRHGYERHVGRKTWRTFLPVATAFLEPITDDNGHSIPVLSVQTVDVPLMLKEKYHTVLDNLETTFPNATFTPELAKARLAPLWSPNDEDDEDDRFMD